MTRQRQILTALAASSVLVLVGLFLGRVGAASDDSACRLPVVVSARSAADSRTSKRELGPRPSERYAPTRAGAISAAADLAAMIGGPLLLDPSRYTAALQAIATPEAASRVRAGAVGTAAYLEASEGLVSARSHGDAVTFRTAPIGAAVDRFTAGRATVRVWLVTVFGRADGAGVRAVWGTSTIRLRWLHAWRLDGWENTPGPTPPLPGAPLAESAALLVATADLRGFRYAPERP